MVRKSIIIKRRVRRCDWGSVGIFAMYAIDFWCFGGHFSVMTENREAFMVGAEWDGYIGEGRTGPIYCRNAGAR